jgi:hypothetical protein
MAGRDERSTVLWLCQCDCGNKTIATTGRLEHGYTKSCGCLRKEKCSKNIRKWLSVKDKLPEKTGEYLTWNGVGVNQDYYAPDLKYNNGFNNPYPITHWMPLPEPPKGE